MEFWPIFGSDRRVGVAWVFNVLVVSQFPSCMGCSLFPFGSWLLLLSDDPLDFVLLGFHLIFWDGLSLHHHVVGALKIILELMVVFISPVLVGCF